MTEQNVQYYNLVKHLNGFPNIIPVNENPAQHINEQDDFYKSVYQYSEQHKKEILQKNSIAGITDVTTNTIIFDFDSKDNLEQARLDAIETIRRLIKLGLSTSDIRCYFSGGKGFHLEFTINESITPQQHKHFALEVGKGLTTFDPVVYNAARFIRVANTKHQVTGFYKTRITPQDLKSLSLDNIKNLAKFPSVIKYEHTITTLPSSLFVLPTTTKLEVVTSGTTIEWNKKPRWLTHCRYALQNGLFKEGMRSNVLSCLAATYKANGFTKEHTGAFLKSVISLQASVNNCKPFPESELDNVISPVYSEHWKGGVYTCKDPGWLQNYCNTLPGGHSCRKNLASDHNPKTFNDLSGNFKEYVQNIDKNTVKTGFKSLDDVVFITTGSNVGLVGAASSGKSSIALGILNNTSKAGVKSVFASLDMASNRMYEKAQYYISGLNRKDLYDLYKNNNEAKLEAKLKEEFGNVYFFQKSSPTVADLKQYILDCQEQSGEKVKLVMVDYFERITSDFNDDVQGSKRIAGDLQDLVNDLDIALVTLVQPNKFGLSGGPESPIYDYTKIKGSSFLYQSFRQIISIWRPGFVPQSFQDDKYLQMAVLKNDLGELADLQFRWDGPKGKIYEMEQGDLEEMKHIIDKIKLMKTGGSSNNGNPF